LAWKSRSRFLTGLLIEICDDHARAFFSESSAVARRYLPLRQ
jgi:hypothetical protein